MLYLWLREHRQGRDEGTKDRPCAIVLVGRDGNAVTWVLVVPVTHSLPENPKAAVELPAAIKSSAISTLDSERSWVVLSETNMFEWSAPDLRRVGDRDDSFAAYGFLSPRFSLNRVAGFFRSTPRRDHVGSGGQNKQVDNPSANSVDDTNCRARCRCRRGK